MAFSCPRYRFRRLFTQHAIRCFCLPHSYVGAVLLLIIGIYFNNLTAQAISIIWFFHIGFDRAIGYGLKYFTGFHDTHLGVIGKKKVQD
jgi:hypothetical protein